jgi:hypothetical protein
MADTLREISAEGNLTVAWARLLRTREPLYKWFYREQFHLVQPVIEQYLKYLSKELRTSYIPQPVSREYVLKPSGLTRLYTVLGLDDYIAYQAIANIVAKLWYERIRPLYGKRVFANRLNLPGNVHFFQDWREKGHHDQFLRAILRSHSSGRKHIARFDISAYYDTISHAALTERLFGKTAKNRKAAELVKRLLGSWASRDRNLPLEHGIPQGPEASSFFGELYLYELDLQQFANTEYFRYVDDIYLLAAAPQALYRATANVEETIKGLGLILNRDKTSLQEIQDTRQLAEFIRQTHHSLFDILQTQPPLTEDQQSAVDRSFDESYSKRKGVYTIRSKTAFKACASRTTWTPRRGKDLMEIVCQHPWLAAHVIPAVCRARRNRTTQARLVALLNEKPHNEHFEAWVWRGLAFHCFDDQKEKLCKRAWNRIFGVQRKPRSTTLRVTLYEYLLACQYRLPELYSCFTKEQSHLSRLLVARDMIRHQTADTREAWVRGAIGNGDLMTSLAAVSIAAESRLDMTGAGLTHVHSLTARCCKDLSLMKKTRRTRNRINDVLHTMFGVSSSVNWPKILGIRAFDNLLTHLKVADGHRKGNPDEWVRFIDCANHLVAAALCEQLNLAIPYKGGKLCSTIDDFLTKVDYGRLLCHGRILERRLPTVHRGFLRVHELRKEVEGTHPIVRPLCRPPCGVSFSNVKQVEKLLAKSYSEVANEL